MLCCFVIALRIHISEATKGILDDLGGFEVEERGEVFLKVCNVYRLCFFFSFTHTYRKLEQAFYPKTNIAVIVKPVWVDSAVANLELFRKNLFLQGKGTWKTYWLISAVPRLSGKVNKLLHPNGTPLVNYLQTPGHHFGSNSSLNLKRQDSMRRGGKNISPCPMKKNMHKVTIEDETTALLNQTSVWPMHEFPSPSSTSITTQKINLIYRNTWHILGDGRDFLMHMGFLRNAQDGFFPS